MISEITHLQDAFTSSTDKNALSVGKKLIQPNGKVSTTRKKLLTERKKSPAFPNKETQWSYFMQAIEPNSIEINVAFPEYHPMWVIQSQKKSVSADYFRFMREKLLSMTIKQCAAYLRVSMSLVKKWEGNQESIPFMAFELLRVVFESANFRLSHKDWRGWFIDQNGRLVSPDRGNLSFSIDELSFIRETHQVKAMYKTENSLLREEVESLRNEISELQVTNNHSLLLGELKEIEERLAELTQKVSNNKVVKIRTKSISQNSVLEGKAA
jgi:DNA-binding transcriptional regulator YiaG